MTNIANVVWVLTAHNHYDFNERDFLVLGATTKAAEEAFIEELKKRFANFNKGSQTLIKVRKL